MLRGVNAGLAVLACLLAATTAGDVLRAVLAPRPGGAALPAAPPPRSAEPPARRAADLRAILERNLFDASTFAPASPPPAEDADPEATQLPLGLLGTVAASEPGLERAALWNAKTRRRRVVRPGDVVADGQATVVRIERQRVLLSEDGAIRELVLDEDGGYRPPADAAARRRRARARARRRAKQARQRRTRRGQGR